MTNPYYNHGAFPAQNSAGSSASMRAELDSITAGFNKLPTLTANNVVFVNASGTALEPRSTINAIAIGGTTPAAGAFTTLSSSGAATLASLTVSGATSLAALSLTSLTVTPGATALGNTTITGTLGGVTDLTTTGNTILGNAVGDTLNVAAGSLQVSASGSVGIGVAPNNVFHIKAASGLAIMRIEASTDGVLGFLGSGNGLSGAASTTLQMRAENRLVLSVGNAQDIILVAGGNVGLGTTTPDSGGFGATWRVLEVAAGSSGAALQLSNPSTAASAILGAFGFISSGSSAADKTGASIRVVRENATVASAASTLEFYTNSGATNVKRLQIDSGGLATFSERVIFNATAAAGAFETLQAGAATFAYIGHRTGVIGSGTGLALRSEAAPITFGIGTTAVLTIDTGGNLLSAVDNTQTLGLSTNRWAVVYAPQIADGTTAAGSMLSSAGGVLGVGAGTSFTTVNLNPGGVSGLQVDSSGKWGYPTGAGGTVTQATSKVTGVTLNKPTGEIVMNNQSLNNATSASFTFTNSFIGANDNVVWSIKSGATAAAYFVQSDAVSAGSCRVHVTNRSAGALAEAIVLQYTVIKGSVS